MALLESCGILFFIVYSLILLIPFQQDTEYFNQKLLHRQLKLKVQ